MPSGGFSPLTTTTSFFRFVARVFSSFPSGCVLESSLSSPASSVSLQCTLMVPLPPHGGDPMVGSRGEEEEEEKEKKCGQGWNSSRRPPPLPPPPRPPPRLLPVSLPASGEERRRTEDGRVWHACRCPLPRCRGKEVEEKEEEDRERAETRVP